MRKYSLGVLIVLTIVSSFLLAEDLSAEPKKLYESAMSLYNEKKYELARTIFQQILLHYPESGLADNALYWRGISYYEEKKYDLALKEFKGVLKDYPQGNKVEDARVTIKGIEKILKTREKPEKKGLKELIAELERELSHKEYAEIP